MEHDNLNTPTMRERKIEKCSPTRGHNTLNPRDSADQETVISEQLEPPSEEEAHQSVAQRSTRLEHTPLVLVWVSIYTTLALFACIVLCILSSRPVTATNAYGQLFGITE